MMVVIPEVFSRLWMYLNSVSTFSVLNIPFQVVMSVCPAIFRYLTTTGWIIFVVALGSSVIHYRLFHIFFVLVLLKADLPDEKDKSFWRSVMIFAAVVFLWGYLGFLSMTNWTQLPQLRGG